MSTTDTIFIGIYFIGFMIMLSGIWNNASATEYSRTERIGWFIMILTFFCAWMAE